MLEEHKYGDVNDATDDRTITTGFGYNLTSWIVALPSNKSVYSGLGIADASKVSSTDYYYDVVNNDASGCSQISTNQTPVKGNMTRAVYWNKDGINPEKRIAYDTYGNPVCTRDANGNTSTISYDASRTFPRISTNPLGHQFTTQYYGVDGVVADKGLYGQVKSTTDPNNAVSSFEYDVFGRQTLATQADGFWRRTQYLNFGSVNSQNVRTDNSLGLWSESYFDGQGRTYKTRERGPDNKVIIRETKYDERGAVAQSSFPYFENLETARYKINIYDALGRTTQTYNQAEKSSSTVLACYQKGVKVTIDPNNHRKRETYDVYGRLIKVDEYTGTYAICSTDVLTPYATTSYRYDVMGNLTSVTDAKNNRTTMVYDTLGRKTSMQDPDMGVWGYHYDANGNVRFQSDGESQLLNLQYDALNRLVYKLYPDQTFSEYTYDETFSSNSKGRLTTMSDASGITKYYYDPMGRNTTLTKAIGGASYNLISGYDGLGRIKSLQYPDNEIVNYTYNTGGSLQQVGSFATYSGYNALRQKGTVTYGNGVSTSHQYYPANNRLYSITANSPTQGGLLNTSYTYDNVGSVKGITDYLPNGTRNQGFLYDELNRLTSAQGGYGTLSYSYDHIGNMLTKDGVTLAYNHATKPHAVTSTTSGRSYLYDDNGNMTSDGVRTIVYNYDNMPTSINGSAVSLVYDGVGARAKKITSSGTKIYLGKFYECIGGVCGKYIFAGEERVALKTPTQTLYYHPDHLGSTSVATDAAGNKVEEIAYYPFGKSSADAGSAGLNHKFTSQELDEETGLYNYGARLYDPEIGRFLSADTIVPNTSNPQSFNRYSYVLNNPLLYPDPTGHSWKKFWGGVEVVVGAVMVYYGDALVKAGGALLMGYGVDQMGGNSEVHPNNMVVVTDGGAGNGSGGAGNGGAGDGNVGAGNGGVGNGGVGNGGGTVTSSSGIPIGNTGLIYVGPGANALNSARGGDVNEWAGQYEASFVYLYNYASENQSPSIFQATATAVSGGFNAGRNAVAQGFAGARVAGGKAGGAVGNMATSGPPAAQAALALAVYTGLGPIAGPAITTYAITQPNSVLDFLGSIPSGLPPSVSLPGLAGYFIGNQIPGN